MPSEEELREAKRIVEEAEKLSREKVKQNRTKDRNLARPLHFHATVWTFPEKDEHGNFKDSQHNEVIGLSPDSCIRKALNRSEDRQDKYHLSQLTECHDPTHGTREMED